MNYLGLMCKPYVHATWTLTWLLHHVHAKTPFPMFHSSLWNYLIKKCRPSVSSHPRSYQKTSTFQGSMIIHIITAYVAQPQILSLTLDWFRTWRDRRDSSSLTFILPETPSPNSFMLTCKYRPIHNTLNGRTVFSADRADSPLHNIQPSSSCPASIFHCLLKDISC